MGGRRQLFDQCVTEINGRLSQPALRIIMDSDGLPAGSRANFCILHPVLPHQMPQQVNNIYAFIALFTSLIQRVGAQMNKHMHTVKSHSSIRNLSGSFKDLLSRRALTVALNVPTVSPLLA